ncbi:putative HotDog domain superfamily protein [Plasmopara halstedii]
MTQVVYWDDSWLYLSHRFQDPTTGKQFAEGLVRCVMMKDRRRVSPYKIIAEVSNGAVIEVPKEMPNVVKNFLEWDSACSTSMQEASKLAEMEIEANVPSPKPEKLSVRIWQEIQRSINLPKRSQYLITGKN